MKFEDALKLMREGKKIRHPSFDNDVYFQACRSRIMFDDTALEYLPISIVKMRGKYQHEDMGAGDIDHLPKNFPGSCKHGFSPQLNLFLIMDDNWEVINENI